MVEVMDDGDTQETLVRCMEREFITTQLVSIIMLYDLSDEVRHLSKSKDPLL